MGGIKYECVFCGGDWLDLVMVAEGEVGTQRISIVLGC